MSPEDSKPLSEEVAELRQRMREIGFSSEEIGWLPDYFIEAVILAMRRLDARMEEKQNAQETEPEETVDTEAKTA